MPVDASIYVGNFDTAAPAGSDPASELDNNIRQVKTAVKNSFPNVTAAVTPTHTELNRVAGVTSAIQTQINAKGAIAGQAWTGAHDYTAATIAVPTPTIGDASTKAASTQFVGAAIAAVNATSGNLSRSTNAGTAVAVAAGQLVACTNSSAVTATFPASPTVGVVCGVWFDNGRADNTVNLGSNSVIGPNGVSFSGVMTVDQPAPVVLAWYGDYWRAA